MCHYDAYAKARDLPIEIVDLNKTDLSEWGVDEDRATRLLHVMHDGKIHVGLAAFLILWDQMPRYRFMARIARIPGVYQILDWGYEHIVARIIYERHLRRKAKGLLNSVHE
jgi:hypothetical protein